jgi:hypothetical protein
MKKFLKNLWKAYKDCWDSDIMPLWLIIHIIISVGIIAVISEIFPLFLPFLIGFIFIITILVCLIINWENDEN